MAAALQGRGPSQYEQPQDNRRYGEIAGGILFGAATVVAGLHAKNKYDKWNHDVSIVSGEGYTISYRGNYLYCGYRNYVDFTSFYYLRSDTWIFSKRDKGWTIKLKDYELYLGFSDSGRKYVSAKPSYFSISEKGDDIFKITQQDTNLGFNAVVVTLV